MVDRLVRLYSVLKASVLGTFFGPGAVFFEVIKPPHWAYSSVGLEHTPDKREVGSSNLPRPTTQMRTTLTWGCSSAGRAAALQAVGRRFDSGQLHHFLWNRATERRRRYLASMTYRDGADEKAPRSNGARGFLIRGDQDL